MPLRKPLQHQRVDPRDVCRSKPEKLRAVLGEDADNVLGACTNLVDRVRHSFDAECNKRSSRHVSEGQKKGRKQTKAFWTQINQLLSELPEMLAPTLEADEEHYARHASQTCDRCQRIYRDALVGSSRGRCIADRPARSCRHATSRRCCCGCRESVREDENHIIGISTSTSYSNNNSYQQALRRPVEAHHVPDPRH